MEIYHGDFASKLPMIKEAIDACDFMAFDTELSGLHRPGNTQHLDSRDFRYNELKEAADRFIIVQFGLCTFKWDQPSGRYFAQPFNFYIYPRGMYIRSGPSRVFHIQAQAFEFLAKQAFDFNKWVYQGIPYLTPDEEDVFVENRRRLMSDNIPDIQVDEKERGFLAAAVETIQNWVDKGHKDQNYVNIEARNAYQRRLLYQEVRNKFPDLSTEGRRGFIRIMRLDAKEQEKRTNEMEKQFQSDRTEAVGFRQVIDWMTSSKKPLVGHNMLLDVAHVIGQFIQPLPDTKEEFKVLAHNMFPIMVDTKFLATCVPELSEVITGSTDLESLRFETTRHMFKNPRIDLGGYYMRYAADKAHEAGYDAFMTGSVFIKLMSYLYEKEHGPFVEEEKEKDEDQVSSSENSEDEEEDTQFDDDEEEEVYNYGSVHVPLLDEQQQQTALVARVSNKVSQARTIYRYFDFLHPEQDLINKPNTFFVQAKLQDIQAHLDVLTQPYGSYITEQTDTATIVAFQRVTVPVQEIVDALADGLHKALDLKVDVKSAQEYNFIGK
ncbi:CAF1-domain-containing protein [Hesseltinella vesiculosa]|uniref:CAF1-domain-containing protein n=1 Tax=Hesseltinella vesiculosa TaxID=101127 RepID=A0A1X2GFJ7_9FUNG|nr:CAF1-domain-containing protein [Hesseltinella vesiculosa]